MSAAREYRRRVRTRVSRSYDGHQHLFALLITSAVGVVAPLLFLRSGYHRSPLVPVVVALGLAYANIVEYVLHRWFAHAVRWTNPVLAAFKKYHSKVHHTFFAGEDWMVDDGVTDLYFVLFPSWIYLLWAAIGVAPLLCGATTFVFAETDPYGLSLTDCALLLSACGAFQLFQYELLHAYSHRALPRWLQGCMEATRLFDGVMWRHRRHHKLNDGRNYNITWPLADFAFGTLASE